MGPNIKYFKKHWPIIVALMVLIICVVVLFNVILHNNGGHFVYCLDDAYIHMSMAKNLADYGVYGVTPYEYTSSSSSLLWTLLLSAVVFLIGDRELTPLALNIFFSAILLVTVYVFIRRKNQNRISQFSLLLLVLFSTSLFTLIFSGMEHVLQSIIVLIFVWLIANLLEKDRPNIPKKFYIIVFALAATLLITRLESAAMLIVVAILFLFRKRVGEAFFIGIIAMLPLFISQLIAISHGWSLLPNSIIMRFGAQGYYSSQTQVLVSPEAGFLDKFSDIANSVWFRINNGGEIAILLATTLVLFFIHIGISGWRWKTERLLLLLFIGIASLHLKFGTIGYFYRYEAYMIPLGLLTIAINLDVNISSSKKNNCLKIISLAVCGVFLLFSLGNRALIATRAIPVASKNIYEQQYQMGRFVHDYYSGHAVALNDIGAVSYYSDIRLLDLVGLANKEVGQLKIDRAYTTEDIQRLVHKKNVSLVIVYDKWFQSGGVTGLPASWTKVGEWSISDNIVCGDDTVAFYAPLPAYINRITTEMQDFERFLPEGVKQKLMVNK